MAPSAEQTEIEAALATAEPDVEILLVEVLRGSVVRVFIDHPDGVTLELCERVTRSLDGLRRRYSLEVSSPGTERPLTKPDHYRRYIGQRARVRTREPLHGPAGVEGKKTFTGELVGASDDEITVAADGGVVSIPYSDIHRSNLVGE